MKTREELERRLREAEERASLLFEKNPHPVWIYDPETLEILEANRAAVDRYGYSRDELTSMTLADLRPEEEVENLWAAIRGELPERGEDRPWRHLTKEGEIRWVEISSTALELEGRPVRLAVVTDVTERRRAERRTAENEARLRAMIDAIPDLLFVIRRDGSFEQFYGAEELLIGPPDQVEGARIQELPLSPAKRDEALRVLRDSLEKGETGELTYDFKLDGEPHVFHGRFAPLDRERGVLVVRDVTSRARASSELRESRERLEAVLAELPAVVWTTDRKLRFTWSAGAALRDLGIPPDAAEGHLLQDYFSENEDVERWIAHHQQALEGASPTYEAEWLGRTFVIHLEPLYRGEESPVGAIGVALDVTEQREAVADLEATRARLEEIVTGAPAVFWVTDPGGEHRLRYISPQLEEVLGWSPAEALEETSFWRDRVHPEDRDRLAEELPALHETGEHVHEYRFRHASGEWRWVRDEMRLLRNEDGSLREIIGFMVDVTEEKQLEEQLRQSQKMEAVGRLAGGIAHDFNNLLTAIGGYADLALTEIPSESPVREDLEEIRRAAERAGDLTGQLLAFSRRQVLQPKILDLEEAVRNMEKILHRVIGEDVELVTDLSQEIGRVRIDPGQLEQVLLNLAVNARDAMPEGGRLTLITREIGLEEPLERPEVTVPAGRWVVIEVEDTGVGMEEELRERIFEPFFTTKEAGEGTGLGLSTAYGIVKQSDGFILVDSEPGRGTRFQILLPRIEEEASQGGEVSSPTDATGSERILVVEDDSAVRDLVLSTLKRRGYDVRGAGDGAEALELANRWGRFDLLISDLVLPDVRGPDVEEALRGRDHDFATLFISGYADDDAISGRLEETEFLPKPFTPSQLAIRVREVLDAREEGMDEEV